jgi:hypothetical protein
VGDGAQSAVRPGGMRRPADFPGVHQYWLDISGTPASDAMRITEQFRRVNYENLEIELTVDDPKTYTKPWTVKLHHTLKLDTDLLDYMCLENEKDIRHLVSK